MYHSQAQCLTFHNKSQFLTFDIIRLIVQSYCFTVIYLGFSNYNTKPLLTHQDPYPTDFKRELALPFRQYDTLKCTFENSKEKLSCKKKIILQIKRKAVR